MKVTNEKTENRQAFLNVEMEESDMVPAIDAAFNRLAKKTTIPGFRKGKAPRQILQQYLGHATVLEEAIDHMLPQAYEQALKEADIEPYAQPEVQITNMEPLAFKATVPLKPTVELGNFTDIRIDPIKVDITDESVNNVFEQLRHQQATWEPVDRPLQYNDLAVMDIKGIIDDKPYVSKIGAQIQILKDSVSPAPGFAEQVAGMKQGEEKEFSLTYPEDYPVKDNAGKEIKFSVKIGEIKEEKLPELDDEFAGQVSSEFKTLNDLKEEIVKSLTERAQENSRMDHEERVINAVIDQSTVDYPPVLVGLEIDRILQEQERQMGASGKGLDDYLQRIGKSEEQLRADLEPIARKNIVASLILSKVAETDNVTVTEEDIDDGINSMCTNVGEDQRDMFKAMINTEQTRNSLSTSLRTRKTIEHLTAIAKTEDDKPKTVEKTVADEISVAQTETKEEEK